MIKRLLLLLCCIISLNSYAQPVAEPDTVIQVLAELTISSSLFDESELTYTGSLTVLDAERMTITDGTDYQPLLNTISGVFMQSGALNTNRITIRGMGARSPFATNKIKAYLNDIPLTSGDGETAIEDIDMNSLKGIEVYRGPVASQFGAGLGGAIHLLANNLMAENIISLRTSVHSFGRQSLNLNAQMSYKIGGINLFYQKVHSDGYRDNNQYDRSSLSVLGQAELGPKNVLTAFVNYTNLEAQIPGALDQDDFKEAPQKAAFIWGRDKGQEVHQKMRMGLSVNTVWNKQLESTVALYVNHRDAREITPISSIGIEEVAQLNYGLRAKVRGDFFDEKLITVVGIETMNENFTVDNFVNNESINGDLMLSVDQMRRYSNVFISSKCNFSPLWKLELGANLNWSQFVVDERFPQAADALKRHRFDPQWSPKISLAREWNHGLVYASVSQGFSLPSFEETLSPQREVKSTFVPESGWSYELGMKGTAKWRLDYRMALYAMQVKNLLVSRQDLEGSVYYINAGATSHRGLEMELNHLLVDQERWSINHRLSLALMRYRFDAYVDAQGGDFSSNDLTGVPNHTFNYLLKAAMNMGIYAQINAVGVGSMPLNDANIEQVKGYHLWHGKIGYDRAVGRIGIRLTLGINNIFDLQYASMVSVNARGFGGNLPRYYYPGLPRNFEVAIRLGYSF